ncbi:MAG: hypothetical protein M0D54_09005 [Hyphomonadaceae bacterium JAD_PAG50586_4]|nr:MAG: hypothetical protein M0D54_09005 [Hyphomonadaceae bacterium JAD_PAG50586_4]
MSNAVPKLDLAAAARRLTAAQVGIRERRRFRRIPIEVNGRLLDRLGRELDCRTADISPATFASPRQRFRASASVSCFISTVSAASRARSPAIAAKAKPP